MPIEEITVGGVTYTRRVRGVSKGGVVLPPGGVLSGGVDRRWDLQVGGPNLRATPTPAEVAAIAASQPRVKPSNPFFPGAAYEEGGAFGYTVSFMWAIPLEARLLPAYNFLPDTHLVIPLISSLYEYVASIGVLTFRTAKDANTPLWTHYNQAMLSSEPELYVDFLSGVSHEEPPETYASRSGHPIPLHWKGFPGLATYGPEWLPGGGRELTRDPLLVGEGNYAPGPGDRAYAALKGPRMETEAWRRAFEEASPAVKAGIISQLELELSEDFLKRADLVSLYTGAKTLRTAVEAKEKLLTEKEKEAGEVAKEEAKVLKTELEALRHALYELVHPVVEGEEGEEEVNAYEQHNVAYAVGGPTGMTPEEWEPDRRRKTGPFLNGVKKWAYSFNLSKPPWVGAPDITLATKGTIIVELAYKVPVLNDEGQFFRNLALEPEGTAEPGVGTPDMREWHDLWPEIGGLLDNGMEAQHRSGAGAGTPPQVGTVLTGAAAH